MVERTSELLCKAVTLSLNKHTEIETSNRTQIMIRGHLLQLAEFRGTKMHNNSYNSNRNMINCVNNEDNNVSIICSGCQAGPQSTAWIRLLADMSEDSKG